MTIATCILLAGCLWIAIGSISGKRSGSLHKATGSLAMLALSYSLFASRGSVSDWLSVVAANVAFSLFVTTQADAIADFYQKRLPIWGHLLAALCVAIVFSLLIDSVSGRVIASGLLFGSGLLAVAVAAHRLHAESGRVASHALMVGGYIAAAAAFYLRALMVLFEPTALHSMMAPGIAQTVSFFTGYAVVIVTSFGFLVLHKDRVEEEAQKLALTDPLTETFNRRIFLDLAEREIARTRRTGAALCLIMFDLDFFKRVNDQFGHLTGDAVLKRFADIVREYLRKEDLLVRYGGEEFCVMLPNVELQQAVALAERIRAAVENAVFLPAGTSGARANPTRVAVRVSAGVARFFFGEKDADLISDDEDTLLAFINRADEALYAAKENGRNRVVAYPENATVAALSRSQRIKAAVFSAPTTETPPPRGDPPQPH